MNTLETLPAPMLAARTLSLLLVHVGALLPIAGSVAPPRPDDATYRVAIWSSMRSYSTDPGLMTWGRGRLLFGRLA